jgi:CDP-diglyceride synthetase
MDIDTTHVESRGPRGLWFALLVIGLSTAAICGPYWAASYESVSAEGIFGSFFLLMLVLFAGTFLAGAATETPLWIVVVGMLGTTPLAVVGRVVLDTATDPTSHNLWPLEIVFSFVLTVPPIGVAAGLAWAVRRLSP